MPDQQFSVTNKCGQKVVVTIHDDVSGNSILYDGRGRELGRYINSARQTFVSETRTVFGSGNLLLMLAAERA